MKLERLVERIRYAAIAKHDARDVLERARLAFREAKGGFTKATKQLKAAKRALDRFLEAP